MSPALAYSLVMRENMLELMMMLDVFIPLICLVKYFWPRYKVANDNEPVASLRKRSQFQEENVSIKACNQGEQKNLVPTIFTVSDFVLWEIMWWCMAYYPMRQDLETHSKCFCWDEGSTVAPVGSARTKGFRGSLHEAFYWTRTLYFSRQRPSYRDWRFISSSLLSHPKFW